MLDGIFYRNLYHHGRKYFLVKMDGSIYGCGQYKAISQCFTFQVDKRIDKVQFLSHGNTQLLGQFQVAPHQFYQPTHISDLLVGVVTHLTVQNVKNEMGRNPVTDILHTQSGNHILTSHLQQETLSLVVCVDKYSEPQNTDTGKHPQVKRLVQRQNFILFLLNENFLLHQRGVLTVFQINFSCTHFNTLITCRIINTLIFHLIIIGLFEIPHLFKIMLQVTVTDMLHIRFHIIRLYSLRHTFTC